MSEYNQIIAETDENDERICHIQLDTSNGTTRSITEWLRELYEAFTVADRAATVDVIVLATGDLFCSGADLGELTEMAFEEGVRWMNQYFETIEVLRDRGKPVVAAVEGTCAAGGNELVMGCDLVVASESARFGQPEVGVDSTAAGGVQLLPLLVGEKRAREMLLLGEMYPVDQMLQWGCDRIVNNVIDILRLKSQKVVLDRQAL